MELEVYSKKPRLGYSLSSHDAHTMAHATFVGPRGSGKNLLLLQSSFEGLEKWTPGKQTS